jgi:hypothetical protein
MSCLAQLLQTLCRHPTVISVALVLTAGAALPSIVRLLSTSASLRVKADGRAASCICSLKTKLEWNVVCGGIVLPYLGQYGRF